MYPSPEHHKQVILTRFEEWMVRKYDNGQQEHGGRLWEKPGMLENAIDEAIDLVVYLFTLQDQIEQLGVKFDEYKAVDRDPS